MYIGHNSVLYFVSPFKLKAPDARILMDFTYRQFANSDSSKNVSTKFTVFSEMSGFEKIKKAGFSATHSDTIWLNPLDRLFVEKENNLARYDGNISYDTFKGLFQKDNIYFHILLNSKIITFDVRENAPKVIQAIRQEIFETEQSE
jgi:hypothetical protein